MKTTAPPRTPARAGLSETPRLRRAVLWFAVAPLAMSAGWVQLSLIAWHVLPDPEPYPTSLWVRENEMVVRSDARRAAGGAPLDDWTVTIGYSLGGDDLLLRSAYASEAPTFVRHVRNALQPFSAIGCGRQRHEDTGRREFVEGETWMEFSVQ